MIRCLYTGKVFNKHLSIGYWFLLDCGGFNFRLFTDYRILPHNA